MRRPTPIEVLTTLSFITLSAGLAITARGAQLAWNGNPSDLLGPGATITAASIAGIISSQSITTWKNQRNLDRDRSNFGMKQEIYGAIAQDLVNTFPSGSANGETRKIRATAAVWASPETIQGLSQWRAAKQRAIAEGQRTDPTTYELSPKSQEDMKTHLSQVVAAMRSDLFEGDSLRREDILKSIFDDSHS